MGWIASVCRTPWDPMDCSPSGSSVHGILHIRILEWVAVPSSRGSSWPRDQTCSFCTAGEFFTAGPPGKPLSLLLPKLICYFSSLNIARNFEKRLNLVSNQLKEESELSTLSCHKRPMKLNNRARTSHCSKDVPQQLVIAGSSQINTYNVFFYYMRGTTQTQSCISRTM